MSRWNNDFFHARWLFFKKIDMIACVKRGIFSNHVFYNHKNIVKLGNYIVQLGHVLFRKKKNLSWQHTQPHGPEKLSGRRQGQGWAQVSTSNCWAVQVQNPSLLNHRLRGGDGIKTDLGVRGVGSNPTSATFSSRDFRQVASLFWASIFSSGQWKCRQSPAGLPGKPAESHMSRAWSVLVLFCSLVSMGLTLSSMHPSRVTKWIILKAKDQQGQFHSICSIFIITRKPLLRTYLFHAYNIALIIKKTMKAIYILEKQLRNWLHVRLNKEK